MHHILSNAITAYINECMPMLDMPFFDMKISFNYIYGILTKIYLDEGWWYPIFQLFKKIIFFVIWILSNFLHIL